MIFKYSKLCRAGGRGWLWGGCSANVEFGERISKEYVDAEETGQDSRAAVNLHNNAAGRLVSYFQTTRTSLLTIHHSALRHQQPLTEPCFQQAVKDTMTRICRCHGMSESCSVKTCWTQLSDFRAVGNYLRIKYSHAEKLDIDQKRMNAGNSADIQGAIMDALGSIAQSELIYLQDSPDYCRKNASLGAHGTEGRECLLHGQGLTQGERRSCRRLCHECGLRVEEKRTEVMSSCNCKFHWCCKVHCEDCAHVTVKHVCGRKDSGDGKRRDRGPK